MTALPTQFLQRLCHSLSQRLFRIRFLLARRLTQLTILALFILSPLLGIHLLEGNLAASQLLGSIPLNDPFVFVQSLLTGYVPIATAWFGIVVISGFYALVGGRVFCAWVCPINIITDLAAWLRERFTTPLGLKQTLNLPQQLRYYWLAGILLLTLSTQQLFFETVNPVHGVQRFVIFFSFSSLWAIGAIFFLDFLLAKRAWCSHLCPVGAFYSLLSPKPFIRIRATQLSACNFCMDCVKVCPEPQIVLPVLKQTVATDIIDTRRCTNCARCVEVCDQAVFTLKWVNRLALVQKTE